MFLLTAILTGVTSYFLSSIFKKGIYFLLIFFALVIFNMELLSLFKSIAGINIFILTLAEAVISIAVWYKCGGLHTERLLKPHISFFNKLKSAFLEDKSLFILFLFWLFLIIVSFILASLSPVNEPDAQGYHALRALFFGLDGFIHHFETADVRCHCMPINSELFYAWVLSLSKTDTTIGLLQFFSYFALIISSYKIMQLFNIDFKARLWSIFIFSSFAGIISQISSTQTDLTVGALFSISMYLILEYKKNSSNNNPPFHLLYFSSLALSISMGVKSTGVIGSIPLIIYYIFILRDNKKQIFQYIFFLILNFFIFSSYNYILNFINYGSFFGAKSAIIAHGFWGGIPGVAANFIRFIFQFFDFAGFTIGFYLNPYLLAAQKGLIELLHISSSLGQNVPLNFTNISMTEQVLGFGVLGFILFLPCLIIGLFKKNLRIFALIFWAQVIVLSSTVAYMIYSIRFIVSFAALAIPLISISYFKKMNIYKFIVILFCFFYCCYASLFLSQRPLKYLRQEFKKGESIQTIQNNARDLNYKFYPSFNEAYTMKKAVEPYCKNNKKIAIFASNGYMLYSTKYLELNNSCKVNTLNALHLNDYELKSYDVIITQKFDSQKIEAINKKDINNPLMPDNRQICVFTGINKQREPITLDYTNLDKATAAQCIINKEYLNKEGFIKSKDIEANLADFLKERTNETVKDFVLWEKVN